MKIFKKTSISLFLLAMLTSFTSSTEIYVGEWKGEDKGDAGTFLFSDDGYATFITNGKSMGGKSYMHDEVKASMKYEVNKKVTPFAIDFIIVQKKEKKELGRLKGLLKIINEEEMLLSIGFGGAPRPENFEKDVITLNRVK
tara:strand:- start:6948 stop:7370 length:423 start_codon:yes stop_codon:yes gene_type:complete